MDGAEIIAIPDSVVSRPDDDNTSTAPNKFGLVVQMQVDASAIGSEISNLTEDVTRGYLYEIDGDSLGDLIQDVDVSDKSAGDAFTFDDVNLTDGEEYGIVLDAEGDEWTIGNFDGGHEYPYTSDDLDIVARIGAGGVDDGRPNGVNNIGNVGFD